MNSHDCPFINQSSALWPFLFEFLKVFFKAIMIWSYFSHCGFLRVSCISWAVLHVDFCCAMILVWISRILGASICGKEPLSFIGFFLWEYLFLVRNVGGDQAHLFNPLLCNWFLFWLLHSNMFKDLLKVPALLASPTTMLFLLVIWSMSTENSYDLGWLDVFYIIIRVTNWGWPLTLPQG